MNLKTLLLLLASLMLMQTSSVRANPPPSSKLRTLLGECYEPILKEESFIKMEVNGVPLSDALRSNFLWLNRCVKPLLPGSREERARLVANAAWWAIREDIWGYRGSALFSYSSCNTDFITKRGKHYREDVHRSSEAGFHCPSEVWQVGIAAVQAKNHRLEVIEAQANEMKIAVNDFVHSRGHAEDFKVSSAEILKWSAHLAGFDRESAGIQNSSGWLRASWYLRNPWIAVMAAQAEVHECTPAKVPASWCSNGNSSNSIVYSGSDLKGKKFSPARQLVIKNAIHDLERISLELDQSENPNRDLPFYRPVLHAF